MSRNDFPTDVVWLVVWGVGPSLKVEVYRRKWAAQQRVERLDLEREIQAQWWRSTIIDTDKDEDDGVLHVHPHTLGHFEPGATRHSHAKPAAGHAHLCRALGPWWPTAGLQEDEDAEREEEERRWREEQQAEYDQMYPALDDVQMRER